LHIQAYRSYSYLVEALSPETYQIIKELFKNVINKEFNFSSNEKLLIAGISYDSSENQIVFDNAIINFGESVILLNGHLCKDEKENNFKLICHIMKEL